MTDYSSIPQVNALYNEQQQVQNAITMIDTGGTLISFVIAPPPPVAGAPPPTTVMMASQITLVNPAAPETMTAIREQLVLRDAEITDQLVELGVTDGPPAKK